MADYEVEDGQGNRFRISKGAGPAYYHPENIGAGSTFKAERLLEDIPFTALAAANQLFYFDTLCRIPDCPSHPRQALAFAIASSYLTIEKISSGAAVNDEQPDPRAELRVRIQQALTTIIAGERAEAAMHQRQLDKESTASKVLIYTGSFMEGIGSSAWGALVWAKEVSDLANPVVVISHHAKALRTAWESDTFAETYTTTFVNSQKRELVEVLGFDPTTITSQQIDEAIAMTDLVLDDPSLRDMLYRFVKDYAEAQHAIEITNVAGSGAFELILTIILAAVTGGAGVIAAVSSKTALIRKFQKVGDLLSEFAKATHRMKLKAREHKAKSRPADFKDLETTETTAKKGTSGPASSAADNVTELQAGQKGGWNKELNGELKPDHSYKVGDYLYETDSEGRVSRVSGKLDLNTRDRNTYQQGKSAKEAGIKDGLADDDGGHLIASIFDGAGEQINYAPMNSNLNRGAWKSMENKWAKALEEGKEVTVDIQPIYEAGSKRPSSFEVIYEIDGKEYFADFLNQAGG